MKLLTYIRDHWAVFTLLMLAAITALSFSPLPEPPPVPGDDKTLHLVAYAALAFPVFLRRPRHWVWIGLSFVVYSGVIELLQPYVNRYGEWMDLAANTAGVVCCLLLTGLIRCFPTGLLGCERRG